MIISPEDNTTVNDEKVLLADFENNVGNISEVTHDHLKKQAEWLIAMIEGHCDESGNKNYNLALGLRRAEAVKGFLIAQGVDKAKLTAVTCGQAEKADEGHNKNARGLNRRVFMEILSGK